MQENSDMKDQKPNNIAIGNALDCLWEPVINFFNIPQNCLYFETNNI